MVSEPNIRPTTSGYIFDWHNGEESYLKINISRLSDSNRGLIGEIEIWPSFMEKYPLLSGIRFNLTSERARTGLAKRLANLKPQIEWQTIIEQVCMGVIELYRQGEPVLELTSNDDVGPLEYLISPLIPIGKPTAIFGDPGSGKSALLLILAIVATLPWHDNPLRLGAPASSSPILYLDYEADADDIRRLLKAFVSGMGLGFVPLHYRRSSLPIADDLESIRNHADATKAKALFIDSTSLAAGGDLNRMDVATSYMRALRQLNMTSVSITHTSKDREAKSKTIIGSVLFEAGFRSVFECRGQEEDDILDIALFHRKFNLGAKQKTLGYRINFNCQGNTVEWLDPKNVPEFVARMSNTRQILELLKGGSKSVREIIDELEISMPIACMALKRLSDKKLVVKLDEKQWGLLDKNAPLLS